MTFSPRDALSVARTRSLQTCACDQGLTVVARHRRSSMHCNTEPFEAYCLCCHPSPDFSSPSPPTPPHPPTSIQNQPNFKLKQQLRGQVRLIGSTAAGCSAPQPLCGSLCAALVLWFGGCKKQSLFMYFCANPSKVPKGAVLFSTFTSSAITRLQRLHTLVNPPTF